MYNYLNAVAVTDAFDGRYYSVDISTQSLASVFNTYSKIFVYLNRVSDEQEVALDLYKLPFTVRIDNRTIVEWLVANGNLALPIELSLPTISYKQAKFVNLWETPFKVKPGNGLMHPDVEISDDQKTDVWLTRPDFDLVKYRQVVENCLFTVNGFIHRGDYTLDGIVIYDANTSKGVQDDTNLGAIDFREFGGIEIIDVNRDSITRVTAGKPLNRGIYLKLPRTVAGTTPFLVVAGYLLPMNKCYKVVSDDIIKLDFTYFNWGERYIGAKEWIDLSALDVETVGEDGYSKTSLYSDETLRRLIDHRQTFVVLVKDVDLRVGKFKLNTISLPNCFEATKAPIEPLMLGDGRLAEYRTMVQGGKVAVFVKPVLRDTNALEYTHPNHSQVVARRRHSAKPYEYEDGYLLTIVKTVAA